MELGTANGIAKFALDLLSNTNETVCGSPTSVGLYHITLWPTLISICCGVKLVNGAVAFPPPALTTFSPVIAVVFTAALTFVLVNVSVDTSTNAILIPDNSKYLKYFWVFIGKTKN